MKNIINYENQCGNKIEATPHSYDNLISLIGQVTEVTHSNAQSTSAIVADLQRTKKCVGWNCDTG